MNKLCCFGASYSRVKILISSLVWNYGVKNFANKGIGKLVQNSVLLGGQLWDSSGLTLVYLLGD